MTEEGMPARARATKQRLSAAAERCERHGNSGRAGIGQLRADRTARMGRLQKALAQRRDGTRRSIPLLIGL